MQFLRELISNASDACDKKRFLSLTDDTQSSAYEGRIRVIADKESNTLTIEDNGIGLSRKDMKENLGRIAQSGTKKFTEALGAGKSDATNLIGQFGVGFYSAFLVADKVAVVSKVNGGEQLRWESTRASEYTISKDDSEPIEGSGTRLILTLKEDADKYTQVRRPFLWPLSPSRPPRPRSAALALVPETLVVLFMHLAPAAV
jgi:heat shock protein beta